MGYHHDTYDRRIQLGASRRRYEDAEVLHKARHWNGAIYLAGYAIECSLKALICYNERTSSLKVTKMFKLEMQGASLHNLSGLLKKACLETSIASDRTGKLTNAWNTVVQLWQKDALRYCDKVGDEGDSERFIAAVKELHRFILNQQGETP